MIDVHLGADAAHHAGLCGQRVRCRRMFGQPGLQLRFGTRNGGPDRPERVVQIERDGTDAGDVEDRDRVKNNGQSWHGKTPAKKKKRDRKKEKSRPRGSPKAQRP